jgi:hypothetical protein
MAIEVGSYLNPGSFQRPEDAEQVHTVQV